MSSRHRQRGRRGRRAAIAAALTALLALALSAPAVAAEVANHPFIGTLIGGVDKTKKPPGGVLEDPCGVAIGPAGETYVADYYHHEVRSSSPIKIDSPNGPCGVAVDSAGNVYVNFWHGPVVKYQPSSYPPPGPFEPPSTYTATLVDPGPATGVAIDPASGDLWIDERTSLLAYETPVAPGQPPLARIGVGSLEDGYGVAASSFSETKGLLYAADAADATVKVFDPAAGESAAPAQVIDGAGTPAGRFVSLVDAGLAVDQSNGELFVADNTQPGFEHPAAVVHEFNFEGLYRGRLEHAIVHGAPVGIAVNPGNGNVYVTSGNGSSEVFLGTDPSEASSLFAFGPAGAGETLSVTSSNPGACAGSSACQVTPPAAATIDAEFPPPPRALAAAAPSTAALAAKRPKRARHRFGRAKTIAQRGQRRSKGAR